jgi:rhodanese-related sulfurtransferase
MMGGIFMISTITRDELKKKIDRHDNFLLLETLEPDRYESGHLPGAINLPPSRLQELAPRVAPKKDQEIVLYCASPT